MKFRVTQDALVAAEYLKKKAANKQTLRMERARVSAESSAQSIRCRVEHDGLHLTWGARRVMIRPANAIKLAKSILKEMLNAKR